MSFAQKICVITSCTTDFYVKFCNAKLRIRFTHATKTFNYFQRFISFFVIFKPINHWNNLGISIFFEANNKSLYFISFFCFYFFNKKLRNISRNAPEDEFNYLTKDDHRIKRARGRGR